MITLLLSKGAHINAQDRKEVRVTAVPGKKCAGSKLPEVKADLVVKVCVVRVRHLWANQPLRRATATIQPYARRTTLDAV